MKIMSIDEAAIHAENDRMREQLGKHYHRHFWPLLTALRKQCSEHNSGCECYSCTTKAEAEVFKFDN